MTQPNNPFKADGFWYKGNIHTHSTNSDGLLDLVQLSYLYKYRGYDFLSITDHNKLTDVSKIMEYDTHPFNLKMFMRTGGIVLIPGQEVHHDGMHLLCLNIKEELPKSTDPQSTIDEARKQGGEVVIAHPYVTRLTINDLLKIEGYLGIEIFNTAAHHEVGKGYSTVHWDDLLTSGRSTYGFAGDDAHWFYYIASNHIPIDAFPASIMVKAKELTVESLMESIKKGLFYSSTGPQILNVELDDDTVSVDTSPAKSITFIGDGAKGQKFSSLSESITKATYKLGVKVLGKASVVIQRPRYLRIEVEDEKGGMAWTNPIYLQE